MLGIDRETVKEILRRIGNGEESKRKSVPSILDPSKDIIDVKVEQELSAKRIYQDIKEEYGYEGSYDTVKNYVATCKRSNEKAFKYFVGVPKTVKIDSLKAAILQTNF